MHSDELTGLLREAFKNRAKVGAVADYLAAHCAPHHEKRLRHCANDGHDTSYVPGAEPEARPRIFAQAVAAPLDLHISRNTP